MDEKDIAWKLAAAVQASTSSAPELLDKAFAELKPTATDIARAYALCLSGNAFNAEQNRLILNARLQLALMREHVTAQRRMGCAMTWLTWAIAILTGVLVVFGGVDLWGKAH